MVYETPTNSYKYLNFDALKIHVTFDAKINKTSFFSKPKRLNKRNKELGVGVFGVKGSYNLLFFNFLENERKIKGCLEEYLPFLLVWRSSEKSHNDEPDTGSKLLRFSPE